MRNPERKRNVALIALAVSAASLVWGFGQQIEKDTWLGALMVADVTAAFFLLCGVLVCQFNLVRQVKLLSGENLIARWRLDAAHWNAFVAQDKQVVEQGGPANWLSPRAPLRPDGGEVVIGKHAFQVDGEFELLDIGILEGIDWFAGSPPTLQLTLHIFNPDGPNIDKVFRLPIAAHAEGDAKRVVGHFARSGAESAVSHQWAGIANRRPLLVRNIALGVMATCAAAGAIAFAILKTQGFNDLAFVVLVGAPITFVGAAILAAITHFSSRQGS